MDTLENKVRAVTGRRFAVSFGTGTAALAAALRSVGVGPGDEVLVPDIVCPTVPLAVCFAGARPVFCDVDGADLNLDPHKLGACFTEKTRAVVAVHLFGCPCKIEEICAWAGAKQVAVVEDFAQALGVKSRGRPLGSYGAVSITSFGKLKILDAGGGGALVTDSEEIAERARAFCATLETPRPATRKLMAALYRVCCAYGKVLALHGRCEGLNLNSIRAWVEGLFLHRLSAEQAAKISAGMERLDDILRTRRQRVQLISSLLKPKAHSQLGYDFTLQPPLTMYTTLLPRATSFRDFMKQRSAGLYALYPPAHTFFGRQGTRGSVSESLANRLINVSIVPEESAESLSVKCRRLALAMEAQGWAANGARKDAKVQRGPQMNAHEHEGIGAANGRE